MTRKVFTFFVFEISISVFHKHTSTVYLIIYETNAKINLFCKIKKKPTKIFTSVGNFYFIILNMSSDLTRIESKESPKATFAREKFLYAFESVP